MAIEKHKLHNESVLSKRMAYLLYPIIFSLFSTLSAYTQTKDSKNTLDPKNVKQTEIITDSLFLASFDKMFNQLTKSELSEIARSKLEKNIILGLEFYFNNSEDTLNAIQEGQMYMKRKRNAIPEKLERFLNHFYKESYRSTGTLSVKILSVTKEDNKIYIEYDYFYTPKIKSKPEK